MQVKNLKLIAKTQEDLKVISAHLQDAILNYRDTAHLKKKQNFSNAIKQIHVGRC